MSYSNREGRERILTDVAEAAAALTGALEALGGAHEQLDDAGAERLERDLYEPLGAATKTVLASAADFARRSKMEFERPTGEHFAPSRGDGPRQFIDASTALTRR